MRCSLPLLAVSLLLGQSACGSPTASDANLDEGRTLDQTLDVAAAIESLRAAGAEVEVTGTILHGHYRGTGTLVAIDGEELQLYEFQSAEEAARESLSRPLALWATTPHFYHHGLVIGLYVGTTEPILDRLELVLGEELAM